MPHMLFHTGDTQGLLVLGAPPRHMPSRVGGAFDGASQVAVQLQAIVEDQLVVTAHLHRDVQVGHLVAHELPAVHTVGGGVVRVAVRLTGQHRNGLWW